MWLLTSALAAILATILYFRLGSMLRLDVLCLMLWGGTVMILVDHVLGYSGGPFLESQTNGLIPDGTLLGMAMLMPVIVVWLGALWRARRGSTR